LLLHLLLIYLFIGSLSGTLSGLLGIGGGIVVVPFLMWSFDRFHLPSYLIIHLASGTSLAIMSVTTLAASRAHQRLGTLVWPIVRQFIPGLIIGTMVGAILTGLLSTAYLQLLLGTVIYIFAYRMFFGIKPNTKALQPTPWMMSGMGIAIGANSGLFGVGAGMLTVPFLVRCKLSMQQAAGTSVACGFVIALLGVPIFLILLQRNNSSK